MLGVLTVLGPFAIDMYLPALPALARDLQAGESASQLTLTACLIALALGQLVAGPLSDILGRRPPLRVGLAGYAVASLLCALAPTRWGLEPARAAAEAGLRLTLLDTCYGGGLDGRTLEGAQLCFGDGSAAASVRRVDALEEAV